MDGVEYFLSVALENRRAKSSNDPHVYLLTCVYTQSNLEKTMIMRESNMQFLEAQ